MDRPRPPTKAQKEKLTRAARLKEESLGEVTVQAGQCEVCVELAAHSVCLLKLTPAW
jgi:hypothetical protein